MTGIGVQALSFTSGRGGRQHLTKESDMDLSGYSAVGLADPHDGWFVGNNGQILKISF